MSISFPHQMAVVPAPLLTLCGLFLLRGRNDESAGRQLLRFLPASGVLLLMLILMGLLWHFMLGFAFILVPGILILLLGWKWGRQHPGWLMGLSMGGLVYYFIGFQTIYGPLP